MHLIIEQMKAREVLRNRKNGKIVDVCKENQVPCLFIEVNHMFSKKIQGRQYIKIIYLMKIRDDFVIEKVELLAFFISVFINIHNERNRNDDNINYKYLNS